MCCQVHAYLHYRLASACRFHAETYNWITNELTSREGTVFARIRRGRRSDAHDFPVQNQESAELRIASTRLGADDCRLDDQIRAAASMHAELRRGQLPHWTLWCATTNCIFVYLRTMANSKLGLVSMATCSARVCCEMCIGVSMLEIASNSAGTC